MVRDLVLLLALSLCLLGLSVSGLGSGQPEATKAREDFTIRSSSAFAQESRIIVEGADSILHQELQQSSEISNQASNVAARILVENAGSILTLDLDPPALLPSSETAIPTPLLSPTPEPTLEPSPAPTPAAPTPAPSPTPTPRVPPPAPLPSPTPWWLEPQWLIPIIIMGLACIAGIIQAVILLARRH